MISQSSTIRPKPNSRTWFNLLCFFLPTTSYVVSAGDYFLPAALFSIAAFVGLLSPSREKKVTALWTLGGFLLAIVLFVLIILFSGDLTLAPPFQWFSGK